ncbi:hypothetical protein T4B_1434, partial [Trichinella pseudospiralis]
LKVSGNGSNGNHNSKHASQRRFHVSSSLGGLPDNASIGQNHLGHVRFMMMMMIMMMMMEKHTSVLVKYQSQEIL